MSQNLLTEAESLISTMHSMLSDLHENFGWNELTSSLEDVSADMQGLLARIEAKKKMNMVEVCDSHFIGKGDKPYLVTGRISGDDDDTPYMILANDSGEAEETFTQAIKEDTYADEDDNDETVYIITSTSLAHVEPTSDE